MTPGGLPAIWGRISAHVTRRERGELLLLLGALGAVVLTFGFIALAGNVLEGDTQAFDERILVALRKRDNPAVPVGPAWLHAAALDLTALGSGTVLGLTVLAVVGFLLLKGIWRSALFVFGASCGGWILNAVLKEVFARPRPDVVPHLREVMTLSFPSGHAMTSAAIYLTLGALMMRIVDRGVVRFYCMAVAMLATGLVGATRVYLGVHYPTDVLAGWLIGLSWALLCWMVERALERQAGLRRERAQTTQ